QLEEMLARQDELPAEAEPPPPDEAAALRAELEDRAHAQADLVADLAALEQRLADRDEELAELRSQLESRGRELERLRRAVVLDRRRLAEQVQRAEELE